MTSTAKTKISREQKEIWKTLSKKAYWDREIELTDWQEKILQAHRSYLPQAVKAFTAHEFVELLGAEIFQFHWPRLKAHLKNNQAECSAYFPMLDLRWSQLTGAGVNLRPGLWWYELPRREKEFLSLVSKQPGLSIYALARQLNMQYRRAHDHALDLIARGVLFAREEVVKQRKQRRLFPSAGMAVV